MLTVRWYLHYALSYRDLAEIWMYLYRAVDSQGQTLDFLLNQTRCKRAAKHFFRKVLGQSHVTRPRVITVDKNVAYPPAIDDLKQDNYCPRDANIGRASI